MKIDMAYKLRKDDIVRALREANIEFDENATLVQLRPLYSQHFGNTSNANDLNRQMGSQDVPEDTDNETEAAAAAATEANRTAAMNEQQQQQNQSNAQQPLQNLVGQQGNVDGTAAMGVQQQNHHIQMNAQQPLQNMNLPGNINANDRAELDAQIEIMRKKLELQRLMAELNQVQQR